LLFSENNEEFVVQLTKTNDSKYFIINCSSMSTTEVWFLESNNLKDQFQRFLPRKENVEYWIEHHKVKITSLFGIRRKKNQFYKVLVQSVDFQRNFQKVNNKIS
jgi:protease II